MTDPVLSTEIANTPLPGYYEPGAATQPPTPNVVPPYTGANVNSQFVYLAPAPFRGSAAGLIPLASIGCSNLSNSLNSGGLTGPASVLAGMSTGAISGQAVP